MLDAILPMAKLKHMSVPVYYGGQDGNNYVWQGGQTENQGEQMKKFFGILFEALLTAG